MSLKTFYIVMASCLVLLPAAANADYAPPQPAAPEKHALTLAERMSLAREFVAKVSKGLKDADQAMEKSGMTEEQDVSRLFPEGEQLLFTAKLSKNLAIQTPILGIVENKKIGLSFRDFVGALELPIQYDIKTGKAQGWYIRENKHFNLDTSKRETTTDHGTFKFSDDVKVDSEDIFVPVPELAKWFGFKIKNEIGILAITINSSPPLPVEEAMMRRDRTTNVGRVGPPSLPEQADNRQLIDYPAADVSTTSSYTHPGDGSRPSNTASASVRTTGDFAYGTLTTQTQLNKDDKVQSLRANYKRETVEPELLGPLKARRYELGDVSPVRSELQQNSSLGTGFRVTNADPTRRYLQPSTEISGTYFPNWDVELYRGPQLMDFQTIGDDGRYRFENVDLYGSNNDFRLVFYGPQGEIREEPFNVPVDTRRLADEHSSYDISILRQDTSTYDKIRSDAEDRGSPLLTALFEQPFGDTSAFTAGLEAGQLNGDQHATLHGGLATTLGDTLLNLDTAVDQDQEMAAQFVARQDFGKHELRNELTVNTDNYKPSTTAPTSIFDITTEPPVQEVLKNEFDINGPIPLGIGRYSRYNLSLDYTKDSDSNKSIDTSAGISTVWNRMALGEQLVHSMSDTQDEDTLDSQTTLSGSWNQNRLRLLADYQVKPESRLDNVIASVQRRLNKDVDLDFGIRHDMDPQLTTGTGQVNWNAGFAYISPSISYNTDHDVVATLNTRFGLLRDPQEGSYKSFEIPGSNNGGVSAFVYLDKNGNNQFDDKDEPIPDVWLEAPQNGGREKTDNKGYALFHQMSSLRLTDVYVDNDTLPDPFWISGYEGAAILPREGYVASLEFPVHISGEMDGTLYARGSGGSSRPLRSVPLGLYDNSGKKIMSALSGSDGFFLFTKIPPGEYLLNIDAGNFIEGYGRPLPQKVHVGYEGTMIYGNNIYMEQGKPDVPIAFLSSTDELFQNPKKLENKLYVLNLGQYKSQLMMGLAWFKVRSFYKSLLAGLDIVDEPSESYPDKNQGEYSLRLTQRVDTLQDAYNTCQIFATHGQLCTVEILPGKIQPSTTKQASAELSKN